MSPHRASHGMEQAPAIRYGEDTVIGKCNRKTSERILRFFVERLFIMKIYSTTISDFITPTPLTIATGAPSSLS